VHAETFLRIANQHIDELHREAEVARLAAIARRGRHRRSRRAGPWRPLLRREASPGRALNRRVEAKP
jgi:hypothetical protein